MKRVGLKYCGGCDPAYDRVAYVRAIQEAGGDRLQWVPLDAEKYSILVIISGCDRECIQEEMFNRAGGRAVISVRDNSRPPEEIVSLILKNREHP